MRLAAGLVVLFAVGGSAWAAEFHATTDVTVMYDAPSAKARPLFVLGREDQREIPAWRLIERGSTTRPRSRTA